MSFKVKDGVLSVSAHIDVWVVAVVVVAMVFSMLVLAAHYEKGFIQWFKDHL